MIKKIPSFLALLIALTFISPLAAKQVTSFTLRGIQATNGVPENQRVGLQLLTPGRAGDPVQLTTKGSNESLIRLRVTNQNRLLGPGNSAPVLEIKEIINVGESQRKREVARVTVPTRGPKQRTTTLRAVLDGLKSNGNLFEVTLRGRNDEIIEEYEQQLFADPNLIEQPDAPVANETFTVAQMVELAQRLPQFLHMSVAPARFSGTLVENTTEGANMELKFVQRNGKTQLNNIRGRVINVQSNGTPGPGPVPGNGDTLLSGTLAQRPNPAPANTTYISTDTNEIFTSDDNGNWLSSVRSGQDGKDGANGSNGSPGQNGANGTNGTNGTNGAPGQACWDLNNNGTGDVATEDTNGDGVVNVMDCRVPAAANPPGGPSGTPFEFRETVTIQASSGQSPMALVTDLSNVSGVAGAIATQVRIRDLSINGNIDLIINRVNNDPASYTLGGGILTVFNPVPADANTKFPVNQQDWSFFEDANNRINIINEPFNGNAALGFTTSSFEIIYSGTNP